MSLIDKLRELRPGAVPGSLFDRVGGRATLDRVHKNFYDKAYEHKWLGKYFDGVPQEVIEAAQSDFMCMSMQGGKIFCGRMPKEAHMHIAVDAELFDIRHQMLADSLDECGVKGKDKEDWLKIDKAFRSTILREEKDCRTMGNRLSSNGEGILSIPKPPGMGGRRAA